MQPIGARLNFRLGKEAEPSSVQLFVNEIDVTKKARISGTRDVPQSHYRIAYTPLSCQPGNYRAEIRFQTRDGTTQSYRWAFTIASP